MTNSLARFAASGLVLVGLALAIEQTTGQIVSPTGTFPPPPGVPVFDVSTPLGQYRYDFYMTRQYIAQKLAPLYAMHLQEPAWIEAWNYIEGRILAGELLGPLQAENGDWLGIDNDGDGAPEPIFVQSHYREDIYVQAHYRAVMEAE
jgi:hypothetical protein